MPMLAKPMLGVSLAGLSSEPTAPWSAGPRAAIDWAATAGFRAVQLDAMAASLRPRELDRSARRDLAALLRRSELILSGIDLWIPPEHFSDAARVSRAVDAVCQAIEMAGELVRASGGTGAIVSLALDPTAASEVVGSLVDQATRNGVLIADHRVSPTEQPSGGLVHTLGIGIDPAAAILAGQDPAMLAARAGKWLFAARLSDASQFGRTVPGSRDGRLDLDAYVAALSIAGFGRPVVLDLRSLNNQEVAARAVIENW